MNIHGRIKRLEKSLASKKKPYRTTFKIAFMGDGKGNERVEQIRDEYFSKYGTYEGLTIVESYVPLPGPAPDQEVLRRLWEESD